MEAFPVPGSSESPPGRRINHLNLVRETRFLSASYFQWHQAGIAARIFLDASLSSSFYRIKKMREGIRSILDPTDIMRGDLVFIANVDSRDKDQSGSFTLNLLDGIEDFKCPFVIYLFGSFRSALYLI